MNFSSDRPAFALAGALALVVAGSWAFRYLDWGHGPARGFLLFAMLAATALIGAPVRAAAVGPRLRLAVNALLAAAAAAWLGTAVGVVAESARTGQIKLDQGQTTYRAARLMLKGENPYGFGALVDFAAVRDRMPQREAAGLGPRVAREKLEAAFAAYDLDLSADARVEIAPPAPATGPAALEAHLLGYKYGPLFPLLALPLAAWGLPAGIMALNALAAGLTLAALYALIRERVGDPSLARMGLAALMCDNTILFNYVERSATDIYALLFMALAALAVLRGRLHWAAAALALGFGFKIFPSALAFPMLLGGGHWRPALTFAVVAGAIYLPFAVVDPSGLLHNVFLWPAYLGADSTSWLAFAPPLAARAARALGLAAIAWVWLRHLSGREPSLFRTLALVALLALVSSATFHNNYVPWASIWIVAALVERFGPPFGRPAGEPAASQLAWRGGAL
jgi:hypothetical protein